MNIECMICCDTVHRAQPIWYCKNCYNIFHLKCAIEWCNKSIRSRNESIAESQYPSLGQPSRPNHLAGPASTSHNSSRNNHLDERSTSVEWPCPACREVLHSRPGKYKCYCGKVVRPEVNRYLAPHSCGQLCGRKRPNSNCPHSCNSICHPGRCEQCPLMSKKSCYCGKLTKEVKCSTEIGSCDDICGKYLSCGEHVCDKPCHKGSCDPCAATLTLACYCGDKTIQKGCLELGNAKKRSNRNFSCDKVCDKILNCTKHRCTQKCHPGPNCPECKLLSTNLKSCPCGSTLIKKSVLESRQSCTDPIPTCENKCNKLLICGPEKSRHKCQKKCHIGSCPPCRLKSSVRCDCSMSTKTIECAVMFERVADGDQVSFKQVKFNFKCEAKCNKPKNCIRHRCQVKCCEASRDPDSRQHICDQVCGKKLGCGIHKCDETCHPGQCGDCPNIGWTELTCHCGGSVMYPPIPCGSKPPACHRPCRRAHDCGHPVKHECHDDTEKCAPCTIFVKKSCFCKADSKDSVYCYQTGYSCGRTCKKALSCRQHVCQRVCHENACESKNDRGIIICKQVCPVPRFNCKHPCGLSCHGKTPCPAVECKKTIEISCDCGNRVERIECHKLSKDVDNRNKVAMLSNNRSNQDSVIIDLSKKPMTASKANEGNQSHKKLDCDDTCAIYKRNKALAEALDISQPDLKPSSIFGEDALRLVREATAQDYKFVASTYNSLSRFIKSAKASEKKYIFMQFPPADELRRGVIHELANHFNCTSECHGEDPEKFVVVKAFKNKCIVPEFTIEQLLPISD